MLPAPDLQELEAQAHYHRDRLALYRARVLTAKPASAARLRELQRASAAADARLRTLLPSPLAGGRQAASGGVGERERPHPVPASSAAICERISPSCQTGGSSRPESIW